MNVLVFYDIQSILKCVFTHTETVKINKCPKNFKKILKITTKSCKKWLKLPFNMDLGLFFDVFGRKIYVLAPMSIKLICKIIYFVRAIHWTQ